MTESPASALCKACGLCCSGHLFSWVRLNAPELDPIEKLGIKVIRNDPRQRGFTQPCPLWNGVCTAYTSPEYPRSCAKYKCQVLRRLEDDDISLPDALEIIHETLGLIREIEALLPDPTKSLSFRERLLAHKEELELKKMDLDGEFLQKIKILLARYENLFGVDDFIDYEK
jgi:hypothetical protein